MAPPIRETFRDGAIVGLRKLHGSEVVIAESFEAAAEARKKRMAEFSPDELLDHHESLLKMIYPDGLDSPIQSVVKIVQR